MERGGQSRADPFEQEKKHRTTGTMPNSAGLLRAYSHDSHESLIYLRKGGRWGERGRAKQVLQIPEAGKGWENLGNVLVLSVQIHTHFW